MKLEGDVYMLVFMASWQDHSTRTKLIWEWIQSQSIPSLILIVLVLSIWPTHLSFLTFLLSTILCFKINRNKTLCMHYSFSKHTSHMLTYWMLDHESGNSGRVRSGLTGRNRSQGAYLWRPSIILVSLSAYLTTHQEVNSLPVSHSCCHYILSKPMRSSNQGSNPLQPFTKVNCISVVL